MLLIGITGTIGSGKTTFATLLGSHNARYAHYESWHVIAEVGNQLRTHILLMQSETDLVGITNWLEPLPKIVKDVTGRDMGSVTVNDTEAFEKLSVYCKHVYMGPKTQLAPITNQTKEQFRPLLQWIGGYLAKQVAGDIWYTEIIRRIQKQPGLDLVTIGGVRFPADAKVIHTSGGIVIAMRRPLDRLQDKNDVTEREVALITPDTIVVNDGSMDQLAACAKQVYKDAYTNSIQKLYKSSSY